jgi:hypothetical protein
MRVAAVFVGLQGLSWLAYHAFIRLPSPFDSPMVLLAAGIVALAGSVGILRGATWGRALGIAATAVSLGWLIVDVAGALGGGSDAIDSLSAPAVVWGLYLAVCAFTLDQLVRRWPQRSAVPVAAGDLGRTAVMLAVVLGAGLGAAWLMRAPEEPAQPVTVEALGPSRDGGLIEMARSGFAISVPEDWEVQTAAPERDVRSEVPGEAWEALRATAPDRRQTCAVFVAVAEPGLLGSGMSSRSGGTEVRWRDGGRTLEMPDPATRIGDVGGRRILMSDTGQTIISRDGTAVDIVYALHCGGESLVPSEAIADSLVALTLP